MGHSEHAESSPATGAPLGKCGTAALGCAGDGGICTAGGGCATPASNKGRSTPFRALLWKEWRESWWLLILTVIAPTGWYAVIQSSRRPDTGGHLLKGASLMLASAVALALGARLFAGEREQGSAVFELERPVTRGMVWNAKLLLPALTILMGAVLLAFTVKSFRSKTDWCDLYSFGPETVFLQIGPVFMLTFASATLCSVLLERTVAAWAGGAVLAVVFFLAPGVLMPWLYANRGQAAWQARMTLLYATLLVVEPAALLWLSRIAYVRWRRE